MKTLFLMSQLPYPLNAGAKIRSFNLIKQLSDNHSITLVTFGNRDEDMEKIRAVKEFCDRIEFIPRRAEKVHLFALKTLFSRYPYSVNKYYSKEIVQRIAELLNKEDFDLIHCDSVQMSRNVLKFTNIPKVLTEHNIESEIWKRMAECERNIFKKAYLYIQYLKLKRYEIFACQHFDHVITVSEEDKKFLLQFIPDERISIVPNGVDTEYFRPQALKTEDSIVFTGSMDWLPNIDAVDYFCRVILPLIWKVNDKIKFYIVGRVPPQKIVELGKKDSRIIITGTVDDVRPYIAKAKIFIVPLRIGGGTRLKILEAMAMETAIVSTPIGCEGLEVTEGKDILIKDIPSDFANAVLKLFDNEELRQQLGMMGRKLVEERYDYRIVSNRLNEVWKNATKRTEIPVLLYHDIAPDNFDITKIEPERSPYVLNCFEFEEQMKWLAENKKEAIIVFDDGWKSNYETAYPILKKYGLTATFFISIDNIGKPEMMTWGQIKEMVEGGMMIGSHSMTHRPPVELSDEELEYEIRESKKVLEEKLGRRIGSFSSPTGFYDERIIKLAKKADYKKAYFSRAILSDPTTQKDGIACLYKIGIKRDIDIETFKGIAQGDRRIIAKLRSKQVVRDWGKLVLGVKRYERVKSAILARSS